MQRLVHIVNPVKVTESSDLFLAQPVTFESLLRAKNFSAAEVHVDLITTQYPEDHAIIPAHFSLTNDLDRSVLDVAQFGKQRKLPLLKDILQRAHDFSENADYIIYSNADIAVMPHFYQFVNLQISKGLDCFVINRRTIDSANNRVAQLPLMYSDYGKKHPGFDCFIFKRKLFSLFELGNVCIGVHKVGVTLLANLMVFADRFELFPEHHLTFHIGEDKVWLKTDFNDYNAFNEQEAFNVLNMFKKKYPEKFSQFSLLEIHLERLTKKS